MSRRTRTREKERCFLTACFSFVEAAERKISSRVIKVVR